MKLSQDLLTALVSKVVEHREKNLNKNYVQQKPSAEVVKAAKKYAAIIAKIPVPAQRKLFHGYNDYTEAVVLRKIFTAPEKKKISVSDVRNEIVLYAAQCSRTEQVVAKYKKEIGES